MLDLDILSIEYINIQLSILLSMVGVMLVVHVSAARCLSYSLENPRSIP